MTKKICPTCGRLMDKIEGKYCSKCESKYKKQLKREERSYNKVRYETDKEIYKFYNSKDWKVIRKIALIRDNFLCTECMKEGRMTKAETVHHIQEVKQAWDKRFDVDNLISLCNKCHNKIHNRWDGR